MLNNQLLNALFEKLGTPPKGRTLISNARIKAPVRKVRSNSSNVITIIASRKMGCEIRTESRHIEYPAAISHEFDPDVVEYYPQPCKLPLELLNSATDRIHTITHTPDFLVIRNGGFTLEEWKSDDRLAKLALDAPYRYQRDPSGGWRSPQIEDYLAELGISYRIYTDRAIPRMRLENLLCLADYHHPAAEPCDPEELRRLHDTLRIEDSLFLADLTSSPHEFSIDFLFKAIADRLVLADLDTEPLTDQRRCRLYRDSTSLEFARSTKSQTDILGKHDFVLDISPGTEFRYGEQVLTIVLLTEKEIVCRDARGNTSTLSRAWLIEAFENKRISISLPTRQVDKLNPANYSEHQQRRALQRHAILESGGKGTRVSERTLRDWRARRDRALSIGANEVLALVPRTAERGNRTPRFSEEQEALLSRVIKERWKTAAAINYQMLYKWVRVEFERADLRPPSYPTVIARVKAQSDTQDIRIRHGKRRAYQQDIFVDVLYYETPVHGSRPLQYVHIDHTQLDIVLQSHRTGRPLGRPWLTLAIDAFSRRILGFYLTYDPPSYHSVMMAVRIIVQRFSRLPEMFVVDNGRDLTSASFRSFLQVMGVDLRLRPAGQPRAGAVIERIFGTAHSQYIHNLAGNTKATKAVRMVSSTHLPTNRAEWTLEAMYHGLNYWACEYYDKEIHPTLGCSPGDMFLRGLRQTGYRNHRKVLWNESFLIATCPPVDRGGKRQVNPQRGVKVNDHYYWNPEFRSPKIANKKLPVRYDPWNAATVYAWIENRWVAANCRTFAGLGQLTEAERRAYTEEYKRSYGKNLNDPNAPHRLREFMQVLTPDGALAVALDRQQENKVLYNVLGMSSVQDVAQPADQVNLISGEFAATESGSDKVVEGSVTATPDAAADLKPEDLLDFDTF